MFLLGYLYLLHNIFGSSANVPGCLRMTWQWQWHLISHLHLSSLSPLSKLAGLATPTTSNTHLLISSSETVLSIKKTQFEQNMRGWEGQGLKDNDFIITIKFITHTNVIINQSRDLASGNVPTGCGFPLHALRSEERRVGKECRL